MGWDGWGGYGWVFGSIGGGWGLGGGIRSAKYSGMGFSPERHNSLSDSLLRLTSNNKANLRDLIAATGLVILLKCDPNHRFFSPCDVEIWCMTSKNNRAPLLYYIKLCVSFQIHQWIQTEVTPPETFNSGRNRWFFVPCELEIWWITLENDRAPLLYYIKLYASFQIHWWIETEVTVQKRSIWVKFDNF